MKKWDELEELAEIGSDKLINDKLREMKIDPVKLELSYGEFMEGKDY